MSAESMHYVGLDVHQRRSSLHVLDDHGQRVKALEVRGGWPALVAEVERSAPRPFAVCYEASCGYGYLYERLAPLAARVAVAHPGHLRLIYRSKRKNDRVATRPSWPSSSTSTWCPACTCRRRTCGPGGP